MPEIYLATGYEAGDEASSTYEGRHLTLEESYLTHPSHADGFVDKGDPVLCGEIVGVALLSAAAATDLISLDTEGIWFLNATATDEDGNSAIAPGDELFINRTTAILSKDPNKQSHAFFGYALGDVPTGTTAVVAVKVHFDPVDAVELVGTSAVPYALGIHNNGREYRYRSTATAGDIRGIYTALGLNGVGSAGEAVRARTIVEAVGVAGGVHGLHGGVEFDADGTLTGLGAGVRGTFLGPNHAHAGGSVAGGMSELFAEGASTNYAGFTEHSIHRFVNDGEATGKATAQNVFSFAGLSATQNQAHNAWLASISRSLRVIVDGAVFYLALSTAP